MPTKPQRPCKHPGCPELTNSKYCMNHEKLHSNDRPIAGERGYDHQWRKKRKQYLKVNPLCKQCKRNGKLIESEVVDHIIPHRGNKVIFWDESNWQALCKKCHDKKTRTEDQYPEYKY
ncbi:MAG: HNH endonuclease [Eubacteriaceae bacterium]|nr:HNH endonuclease [Eubacteriaceae bacterium]